MSIETLIAYPKVWKREEWGAYSVFIRRSKTIPTRRADGSRSKFRMPPCIRVYRHKPDGSLSEFTMVHVEGPPTVKEARAEARRKMREYMDKIPGRIDWLEHEYTLLREFFVT